MGRKCRCPVVTLAFEDKWNHGWRSLLHKLIYDHKCSEAGKWELPVTLFPAMHVESCQTTHAQESRIKCLRALEVSHLNPWEGEMPIPIFKPFG